MKPTQKKDSPTKPSKKLVFFLWLTAVVIAVLAGKIILATMIFTSFPLLFSTKTSLKIGVIFTQLISLCYLYQPENLRSLLSGLDHRFQDTFFQLRGPKKPSGQVVLVDLDQKSLEQMGQWPWPRTQMAKVVNYIHQSGAKVIGMDILFAEKDRMSLKNWLEYIQALGFI